MYTFQFLDGSWRIDVMTRFAAKRPAYGTEAAKLFDGVYMTRREAEAAIDTIRIMVA